MFRCGALSTWALVGCTWELGVWCVFFARVPQELCTWRPSCKDGSVGVVSDLVQRRAGGCGAAEHLMGVVWALELSQRVVRLSPARPAGVAHGHVTFGISTSNTVRLREQPPFLQQKEMQGLCSFKNRRRLLLSGHAASAFAKNQCRGRGVCRGPVPDT